MKYLVLLLVLANMGIQASEANTVKAEMKKYHAQFNEGDKEKKKFYEKKANAILDILDDESIEGIERCTYLEAYAGYAGMRAKRTFIPSLKFGKLAYQSLREATQTCPEYFTSASAFTAALLAVADSGSTAIKFMGFNKKEFKEEINLAIAHLEIHLDDNKSSHSNEAKVLISQLEQYL